MRLLSNIPREIQFRKSVGGSNLASYPGSFTVSVERGNEPGYEARSNLEQVNVYLASFPSLHHKPHLLQLKTIVRYIQLTDNFNTKHTQ